MSAPFSKTSVTSYNTNPPSDDGSQTSSNRVQWSTQKTKLTDPLKTAFDASETATLGAFGKIPGGAGISTVSTDTTVTSGDQGRLLQVTAAGVTVTTPDATSVNSPFLFAVINESPGTITIDGNGSQTVDGETSITLQPKQGCFINTNGSNWITYGWFSGLYGQMAITGAADNGSGLIRLTVSDTSSFADNERANVTGIVGTTEANGVWTITVVDTTHIDLQSSTFTNVYTSGGTISKAITTVDLTSGVSVSGGTLSASPAPPPAGLFTNLSIKVAGNTSVSVAADFIVLSNGTSYVTKSGLSATLSLASNGAVNRLDTGSISAAKWYYVWAIFDGTTLGTLASLSATSPTLPTGFTYKARIGSLRTNGTTAQLLGTYQYGRRAQYVVGLAQCDKLPLVASGTAGTYSRTAPTLANTSVSNNVPTTAGAIIISATNGYQGGAASNVLVAPNTSYGGANNGPYGSNAMVYPVWMENDSFCNMTTTILLESTNLAWCSDAGGGGIRCLGWEDNL